MNRPRLLDLFSCAGGAGRGYHDAGFDVTGVDINPQPRYPYDFVQGDAVAYLAGHGHEYDAIHASPPWTTDRRELAEAIPPAYTRHIGAQLLDHLQERAA